MKVRKAYLQNYSSTVRHHIPLAEKVEIRKWVYCKLLHSMDVKMKVNYYSDEHPDFAKTPQRSLEEMAKQDFHESLLHVYTAKPTLATNIQAAEFSLIDY
eukprot:1456071-Pyramimonas_sp.AAC.1